MPNTTPASYGYDRRYYMFQREPAIGRAPIETTPPAFGLRGWLYEVFKQEEQKQ